MRRASFALAGLAVLSLTLAPAIAEARAGRGGSAGSRGSQTYTPPPSTSTAPGAAQPMQRSMTPATPSAASPAAMRPATPAAAQPSRWGGSFMAGLAGGLIGAGIGGLLFGHGFTGGLSGAAGFIGFLLQIGLLALVVWAGLRLFRALRGPAMAPAGVPAAMFQGNAAQHAPAAAGMAAAPRAPVQIGQSDFAAFEQSLKAIQAAWSARDLAALQTMATPEMVSYFAEDLTDLSSRGLTNTVSDVRLLKGDLAEAWAEQGREYATVAMRFCMIDVTRDAEGRIVEGNPNEPSIATELWTFVRAGNGGRWLLSAIQQAA